MKKIKYATSDYSPSFLPQNRKEVLKDVYHVRFSLILKCGLIILLFAIPLIALLIVMDVWKFGTNGLNENQLTAFYFYWNIIIRVSIIPCLFILLIGISGILRIIKLLVWQEGIDFWYDFKYGVKTNYKAMAIPSLFLMLIYLIYFGIFYIAINSLFMFVAIAFICFFFVTAYLWYIYLSNVYSSGIKNLLTNSMFFLIKTFGWSVLFMTLIVFPFFYDFFQIPFTVLTFILKPLILMAMLVFYYPFMIIVGSLYSNNQFDKWINKENYPDLYRKGLFNAESFIDEEEDLY